MPIDKEKCQFCGRLFNKSDLKYPSKGSPYKCCPSCREELEAEERSEINESTF